MLEKFLEEVLKLAPRQMISFYAIPEQFEKIFEDFSFEKLVATVVVIFQLFGSILFDTPVNPYGEELDLTGYKVVFEDDFNGKELNTDVWHHRGEGERRGGFNSKDMVEVRDGNCVITADYLENGEYGEGWYAGAIALTQKYNKGYFEIRCKVNAGGGFWSAFWIQADHPYEAEYSKGGVGGAEIDIFEAMEWNEKESDNSVMHTIHCAGVDGVKEDFQSMRLGCFNGNDIYNEFNTYGLKWTEDEYIFYVNGIETVRSSFGNGVSQVDEEVIVSLELPDSSELEALDKATYKSEYVIDYVRIYQ